MGELDPGIHSLSSLNVQGPLAPEPAVLTAGVLPKGWDRTLS